MPPQNDEGHEKSYKNFPVGANIVSWRTFTKGIAAATAKTREVKRKHGKPVTEVVADALDLRPVDVFETLRRRRGEPDFDQVLESMLH
ncbi:MAG: hypothetical protein AAB605_03805 [Patescibacteria group bacterium]